MEKAAEALKINVSRGTRKGESMRLIDADKAVEQIDDIFSVIERNSLISVGITKALVRSMLTLESITPTVGGWISVDDRLPNSNGFYIVWRPHFYPDFGMPAICYFDGTDTWHDSYGVDYSRTLCSNGITHWMPLPEPPKEEDND